MPFVCSVWLLLLYHRRLAGDRRMRRQARPVRCDGVTCYEEGSVSSKEEIASVDLCALLLLTAIIASLTRTTPVERPFGFILVFADDTHAHRQLLDTGYREKV
jgi:hypothetical protein